LYVVVTRQDRIQQLSEQLTHAGADLSVIDIPELVLRNLAGLLPEAVQGMALVYLGKCSGVIALCRNNVLYLARTVEMGYEQLQEAIANGQDYLLDNMALEIQRSLDYYDRYFQQAPITQLMLVPPPVSLPGFHKAMQTNLGLESRTFPLREMLAIGDEIDDVTLGHCALAIGAALRKDRKVL
jgi:MSHA biogenesis protein MshI